MTTNTPVTNAQYMRRAFLLLVPFFMVLCAFFMSWYPGKNGEKVNGLDYLDNFFNGLAKSSANYIDEQRQKLNAYNGVAFDRTMAMNSEKSAQLTAQILTANNIKAEVKEKSVAVQGDLGAMFNAMLDDTKLMYNNNGAQISSKYGGVDAREVINSWYISMSALEKDFTKAGKFDKAKDVSMVKTKALEPAYNFYGVQATPVKDSIFLLAFSLIFYVVYTVWFGFGVLFFFEGLGIRLSH